MEKNINPDINSINMETSKNAAASLEKWGGINAPNSPVAASYFNGSTAQMIKESREQGFTPNPKEDTVFSFGLVKTVSALKNSSFNDIPAGKILLEKYEYLLLEKDVPEAFLIEGLIGDLRSFSWENSVIPVLENVSKVYDNRRREIEVLKTYQNIKNSQGRDLYSDATSEMKNWLVSEKRSSDALIYNLKRFGFNPMVRDLISFLSIYENSNPDKFSIGYDNNVCEVLNIYSPIEVNENEVIFYSSGKFLKMNESEGTLIECKMEDISDDLANKSGMISDKDIKISNNKISLKLGDSKLDIIFENDNKTIYLDGKKTEEKDLPIAVSITTNNILENSNHMISKAVFIAKAAEDLIDLDFGKKIKSKIFEGVEANIFKIKDKIFIQTINPSMKVNKIYEGNATQAINTIKDFIKFDISESLSEFLENEEKVLSIMKNDKNELIKNIGILEGEIRKIENIKKEKPLISKEPQLIQLQEGLENEIKSLKDRWNTINIEISRFENKPKEITSTDKEMGYPIDTEVRIKRNGNKGKIIGIDGNSRTYTILFKEGVTGEYFFSEVENIDDEIENYEIKIDETEPENTNKELIDDESGDAKNIEKSDDDEDM